MMVAGVAHSGMVLNMAMLFALSVGMGYVLGVGSTFVYAEASVLLAPILLGH